MSTGTHKTIYVTRRSLFHQHLNVLFLFRYPVAVSTTTRPGLGDPMSNFRPPKYIFLSSKSSRVGGSPNPYSLDNEKSSRGVKRLERDVDNSPQPSAEVNNEWYHASVPPFCPHAVSRKSYSLSCASEGGNNRLYIKCRVILSVLDPRKCEYLKDYSLYFEHAYMTTYLAS